MISSKKLIKLAKRWQKFAAIRRKRISFPSLYDDADSCSTSSAVYKGHFTIYTADQKRFVVPLSYLENEIIRQLLSMSEEEFGLPSDGPITLPCDAVFMEYIISLLSRGLSRELENALLVSVTSHRSKKLIKLAKKWQKFAAIRRKRISFPSLNDDTDCCNTSSAVSKGHFAVYTDDQKRFVVPLSYLENEIIRQLLNMSEEEFGLPSDGPITLPCDAAFMNYIISLLSRGLSKELENALLISFTSSRCSVASLHQAGWRNLELLENQLCRCCAARELGPSWCSEADEHRYEVSEISNAFSSSLDKPRLRSEMMYSMKTASHEEVLQLSASSYRLGNEIRFLRMAANFCHLFANLMSFLELIMVLA
nr:auxin-responsive protein SAUR68-like [Ipomoea batatas]